MRYGAVRAAGVSAVILAVSAGSLHALINPRFTPVHMVRQSQAILELRFRPKVRGDRVTALVKQVLKGQAEGKTIEIDLTATAYPDRARFVEKRLKDCGDRPALMFIGEWPAEPGEEWAAAMGRPPPQGRKAFVHFDGIWLVLFEEEAGWGFDEVSQPLIATWNGGTDMLLRGVTYILKDPAGADMPVRTGVVWAGTVEFARVPGKVSLVLPVDLKLDGTLTLFVASDEGDRLFTLAGKTARDVTAAHGLRSRSLAAAWGDFNGDGLLDLASWDGKTLTLHLQGQDGTFSPSAGGNVPECIGLTAASVGADGKAGLVVATKGVPLQLVPGAGAVPTPLADGKWPGKNFGQPGPCLAADFDGDALPDVLQVLARRSLLYRGTGVGTFAPPVACTVALGRGRGGASSGDWDGDGLLDVFTAAEDGCRIWQNLGAGRFAESIKLSGEVGYIAQSGAVEGHTGDLNNDGRQDILILYAAIAPQVFFNRGFRSFGYSLSLDIERSNLLPPALKGQQAGCLADFTGDGAQDVAMVLNDGQVVLLVRAPTGADLCARAILPGKSGFVGPVTVGGSTEDRLLGAWNVRPGGPGAFFARPEAGPVTIRWRFPGQNPQSREVILEQRPVTVVLEPPADRK